jgi:hypothetical protein
MDLFTATAVELLGSRGYRARRLVEGSPEWRIADLPVAIGASDGTAPKARTTREQGIA